MAKLLSEQLPVVNKAISTQPAAIDIPRAFRRKVYVVAYATGVPGEVLISSNSAALAAAVVSSGVVPGGGSFFIIPANNMVVGPFILDANEGLYAIGTVAAIRLSFWLSTESTDPAQIKAVESLI